MPRRASERFNTVVNVVSSSTSSQGASAMAGLRSSRRQGDGHGRSTLWACTASLCAQMSSQSLYGGVGQKQANTQALLGRYRVLSRKGGIDTFTIIQNAQVYTILGRGCAD